MRLPTDGGVYQIASDGPPRFIGVDVGWGQGDWTTECEVEVTPDGSLVILDIRQTPPRESGNGRK